MMRDTSAFKAYDIRGVYPEQVNASFMSALAKAFATRFRPKTVAIGYDSRLSSEELALALSDGFLEAGVDVLDLGLCGTEMVYYATGMYRTGGGLMITASHNPREYNGCKMVTTDAVPVSADSGLNDVRKLVANDGPFDFSGQKYGNKRGNYTRLDITKEFAAYVMKQATVPIDKNLNVVVNAGNGAAGPVLKELSNLLPCSIEPVFFEPDGHFPNGVPNPLLPECRKDTAGAVHRIGADLGVAFDGDFDRCFFFDENGRFIEGYYIVGLLAGQILQKNPGAKIIHDPRLTWNTIEIVKAGGGIPLECKTGHAFIKDRMRQEKAEYGGEMSAHHYFRSFWYCDTGMLPFLLMLELLSTSDKPLSELVNEAIKRYPVSGECNYRVSHPPAEVLAAVESFFLKDHGDSIKIEPYMNISRIDGLSMEFEQWRFSLRASNTEPLLRLNVESRNNAALMEAKRDTIAGIILQFE